MIVHCQGRIVYRDEAAALSRVVGEVLQNGGKVILDLSGVNSIDSAGIGSAMAANKVPGARAALCYDRATARNSREHNDANILSLGARFLPLEFAREILAVWLETPFAGGRHQRRVDKIRAIEQKYSRVLPERHGEK